MCFILSTVGLAAASIPALTSVSANTAGAVGGLSAGGTFGFIKTGWVLGEYENIIAEITKLSVKLNELKARQQEQHRGGELKKDQIEVISNS